MPPQIVEGDSILQAISMAVGKPSISFEERS